MNTLTASATRIDALHSQTQSPPLFTNLLAARTLGEDITGALLLLVSMASMVFLLLATVASPAPPGCAETAETLGEMSPIHAKATVISPQSAGL